MLSFHPITFHCGLLVASSQTVVIGLYDGLSKGGCMKLLTVFSVSNNETANQFGGGLRK